MPSVDIAEGETFFDTAECLSSQDSLDCRSDLGLGYGIWMSELQSVQERRENFLNVMGFLETDSCLSYDGVSDELGRIVDSTEAVSSSCEWSENGGDSGSRECEARDMKGEANVMVDDLGQETESDKSSQFEQWEAQGQVGECTRFDVNKKRVKSWWKRFLNKTKRSRGVLKNAGEMGKISRMKVRRNGKKFMEFSAVYVGQEFQAHKGMIRTMKFSPDGRYLASGGEDGVVRIWHVTSAETTCKSLFDGNRGEGKSCSGMKSSSVSVVVPDKDLKIEELPLHEFYGHTSDILDLAWSKSNCVLSSSVDKTVRLWKVGQDKCLGVFHHNNYVTCIQFNPVDENYFISGSLDAKVRTWKVSEKRVVNWADVRDLITAICYQPNGKGFIVGSLTGSCRFYETSGSELLLNAEIHIHGPRSSENRITGIQFLQEDTQRVMITSEDSKVRILDGTEIVHKYRGLSKSGSQMSASLTSNGRHIISVGEDSRVYVWNYENSNVQSSKHKRSVRSCEHFFSEGVSVAMPWSGMAMEQNSLDCCNPHSCQQRSDASALARDQDRFSQVASRFFMDGSCWSSAIWPEEKLPSWDDVSIEDPPEDNHRVNFHNPRVRSETWGLVIVTAGLDGMIRTFHNYGLPVVHHKQNIW